MGQILYVIYVDLEFSDGEDPPFCYVHTFIILYTYSSVTGHWQQMQEYLYRNKGYREKEG